MADRMTGSQHGVHDLLLIAAWTADDADAAGSARADALVRRCDECRMLADDLREIRVATSALPAATRTRDFRLSAEDARRLGSRRRWLAALVGLGGARVARPLAGAMTALGLAGLLLVTLPTGQPAGSSRQAAPFGADATGQPAASAATAPGAGASVAEPARASEGAVEGEGSPDPDQAAGQSPALPEPTGGHDTQATTAPPSKGTGEPLVEPEPSPDLVRPGMAAGSMVLIAAGLGLLALTRRRPRHEA